jgi:hypothetical protein
LLESLIREEEKKIECLLLFKIRNGFKKGKCIISQFIMRLIFLRKYRETFFFLPTEEEILAGTIINVKQLHMDYYDNPFKAIPTET